jgi:hypothetical protein
MKTYGPYKVFSENGKVLKGEYASLEEVVYAWPVSIFRDTQPKYYKYEPTYRYQQYADYLYNDFDRYHCHWIVKESNGLIVPVWKLKECYYNIPIDGYIEYRCRINKWWWLRYNRGKTTRFNHNYHNRISKKENRLKIGNPKKRINRGGRMRIFSETKVAYHHEFDGWAIRGRRNYNGLPDPWDVDYHNPYYNRNWKRFRKTQWKPK